MIKIISYLSEGKNINIPDLTSDVTDKCLTVSNLTTATDTDTDTAIASTAIASTATASSVFYNEEFEKEKERMKKIDKAMNDFVDAIYNNKTKFFFKSKQDQINDLKNNKKTFSSYGDDYKVLDDDDMKK